VLNHVFRGTNQFFAGIDKDLSLLSPVERRRDSLSNKSTDLFREVFDTFFEFLWNLLTRLHHGVHHHHISNTSNGLFLRFVKLFGVLSLQSGFTTTLLFLRCGIHSKVRFNIVDLGLYTSLSSDLAQLLLIGNNFLSLDLGFELLDLFKLLYLVSDFLLQFSLESRQGIILRSFFLCAASYACGDFVRFFLGSAITHFQNSFFLFFKLYGILRTSIIMLLRTF
jgi:hypothetical protein